MGIQSRRSGVFESTVVPLPRWAGRSYGEVVIRYRGRTGRPRLETGGIPMTTITSTAALVLAEPVFSDEEKLALAGFLAGTAA
jgi:hypothetical protein